MKRRIAGLLALMCVFWVSCKDDIVQKPIPPTIDLLTPADAANGVDIGPTFTWSATDVDDRSMTYDFYIGPDSTKCIQQAAGLTTPSYTLSEYTLKKENVYYWYIYVSNGESRVRSKIYSFRSIPAPEAPVLSGPAEGAFVRDQLTFSWEPVAAGEGETIVYEVFFGEDKNAMEKVGTVDGATSLTYDPTSLEIGKVYYWLVKASDLINATASEPMSFKKLMTGAPDEPMIVSPENKLGVYDQSVTLSWTEVSDPESDQVKYDVYVGNEYPPSTLVAEGITASSYTVAGLETNKPYYWMVVAKDASNNYTESAISTFTKMGVGAPSAPQIADLAVPGMLTLDEVIKWNAVSEPDGQAVTYDVYVGTSNPPTNKVAGDLTVTEFTILNEYLACDITDVKTFYCMVVAKDEDGNESNSVAERFKPQMTGVFIDDRGDEVEEYKWVRFGKQVWMSENFRSRTFTDGNPIPNIGGVTLTAGKAMTDQVLSECFWDEYAHNEVYPNNDWAEVNGRVYSYGCIYHQNFAPSGWHVMNKSDESYLKSYSGSKVRDLMSTWYVLPDGSQQGVDKYGLRYISAGWRYPTNFRTDYHFINRADLWVDAGNASVLEFYLDNGKWRYFQYDTKMMFGIRMVKNQ